MKYKLSTRSSARGATTGMTRSAVIGVAAAMAVIGSAAAYLSRESVAELNGAGSIDPHHISYKNTSGRTAVDCRTLSDASNSATILVFGQSMVGNSGDPGALYIPSGKVYNFNLFDGRCYEARDPLLGTDADRSNVLTRFADLLVRRHEYETVLLVPIAYGGSPISWWAPGGPLSARLDRALRETGREGLRPTFAIWQQGEADSYQPRPDAAGYEKSFRAMVDALRAGGMTAPVFVAQSTVCKTPPIEPIRWAQREVVDARAGILPGPDTDVIGLDDRFDGCHFSEAGLNRAAEMWFRTIAAWRAAKNQPQVGTAYLQ